MNQPTDAVIVQADWVSLVKDYVSKLNALLQQTPAGVELNVSAEKSLLLHPGVQPYGGLGDEAWQIKLSAKKIEQLI